MHSRARAQGLCHRVVSQPDEHMTFPCRLFQNNHSCDTFYMLHAFYFLLGTGDHDQNVPLNHIYNISPLYTSARIVTSLIDFIDTF